MVSPTVRFGEKLPYSGKGTVSALPAESGATTAGSSRSTNKRNGEKMKKTKWILVTVLALGAGALGGAVGCSTSSEQRQGTNRMEQAVQYTCPMHPEVVQSTPGKCPKCGMDLVEKH